MYLYQSQSGDWAEDISSSQIVDTFRPNLCYLFTGKCSTGQMCPKVHEQKMWVLACAEWARCGYRKCCQLGNVWWKCGMSFIVTHHESVPPVSANCGPKKTADANLGQTFSVIQVISFLSSSFSVFFFLTVHVQLRLITTSVPHPQRWQLWKDT